MATKQQQQADLAILEAKWNMLLLLAQQQAVSVKGMISGSLAFLSYTNLVKTLTSWFHILNPEIRFRVGVWVRR